jgi:uncharacterized heparinase superfamily protein
MCACARNGRLQLVTGPSVAERLRHASQMAGRGLQRVRQGLGAPVRLAVNLRAPVPERLVIAPQDIRTTDPTIANDIYGSYFSFEGKVVNTHGQSPFTVIPPAPSWARALMGFGWLRHLRAAGSALSRENARALVGDWIGIAGKPSRGPAWETRVVARRILSWLSQSPLILEGADRTFYQKFLRSLARQTTFLRQALATCPADEQRLLGAIALAEMGLCAEGLPHLAKKGTQLLVEELRRQILADGGHVSRNPRLLVEFLLDLLPVRQAYAARGQEAPAELLNAIDRMMPMLRMFRHGDGSLALFNGMGVTAPETLATILAYGDARGTPITNARQSGYQRLEANHSVIIMDTGRPPPAIFSRAAHASCLAFEFSSGPQRIVINCGVPEASRVSLSEAARATAAHSTLTINDLSSSRIAPTSNSWGGEILSGPTKVPVSRTETATETLVVASHDGYARRLRLLHQRKVSMSASGKRLDGEDSLLPWRRRRKPESNFVYAIRFHLHPSIEVQRSQIGDSVHLCLPSGEIWVFTADGGAMAIEESGFFAAPDGPRRTEQIVLRSATKEFTTIAWSFTCIAANDRGPR